MTSRQIMISLIMFVGVTFGLIPRPVHAQAWGAVNIFSDLMINVRELIQRQTEGMLLGTLQMAAIQTLNNQVGQLIGGGSGGTARIIQNFDQFIRLGPQQRTDLFMNDFFTMTTRGRGSSANYISSEGVRTVRQDYVGYLDAVQRQAVSGGEISVYNLDEYGGSEAISMGSFRALNAYFSNPCNNPYGCALQAEIVSQNKLEAEKQAAIVEAQSSGFVGVKQGNDVVAPAGAIEAIFNNTQDLPNKIIAAAENPAALLNGVVTAMATKMVNNLVQRGVGDIQSNISRQLSSVNRKVSEFTNQAVRTSGPGALFSVPVSQQGIRVNPSTPTIPSR